MIDYSNPVARDRRLDVLLASVPRILDRAVEKHITGARDKRGRNRRLAAVVTMFSGGNDSTVLAHLMRGRTDYFAHANTGIGVEATRAFVRKTCAEWGVPLLEFTPAPGRTYDEWVVENGFPGPGKHGVIFNRIKGSPFEQVNKLLVANPYRERVLFVGGRRFTESERRKGRKVPVFEQKKSVVWVSPLRGWTALDLNTYRMRFPDCPRNEVSEALGMSGECLCGAFAAPGELDTLRAYPPAAEAVRHIDRLAEAARANGVPEQRCAWGWGATRDRSCREGCNA